MTALHRRVSSASRRGRFGGALLLAMFAGAASFAYAGGAGSPIDVRVSGNADRILLQYTLGSYRARTVSIGGEDFQALLLAGEPVTMQAGAPRLPKVCRSIIIPDDARVAVRVLAADYYDVSAQITPSRGSLPRSVDPADVPYAFGGVYQTDAFYPGELAQLGRPYILRDYRGVVVELYPFQYNPATGVLRVYTSVTVEVVRTGPGEVNVLERAARDESLSRAFYQLYKHHFINYRPDRRYPPLDEDGDMLIIVHDPWLPNVEPLAAHKNSIGINTTVGGVSTIGNDATAIKNYIQSVYDTSDLAFVLLVGDVEQVATPYAAGSPADPTYAKLAGGDDYPDIMVGRFSAQNALHVDTQVQRTIEYEVNQATQQEWFWRGAGIGSNTIHLDAIRDALLTHGYTHVDQIYDPDATPEMIAAALNDGRGIVNYIGHGGSSFWGTGSFFISDVEALVNDNMLPFIFSVASCNGNFAVDECFAEAWLRAEQGGVPTGAIAAYMASDYQYWDGPLVAQQEFVDLYVNEAYVSFGTLCFAGACRMIDEYGSSGVMMFDTWIVFGDPSLRVVGTVPEPSVRYVDDDAALGGNGLHWETAYKHLQDALYEAVGDPQITEIRVAGGVYKPDQDEDDPNNVTPGDREATFQLVNGVGLYGGYRGLDPNNPGDPDDRDPNLFESILSGDLAGNDEPDFVNNDENSYHVVNGNDTDATGILDGFSVTGGNADGSGLHHDGAGMYCARGSPTVVSCIFHGNAASYWQGSGGGIACEDDSTPSIANCVIIENSAAVGGGVSCGTGSNLMVTNCHIADNSANYEGGGIRSTDASPMIVRCTISANATQGGVGGGLAFYGQAQAPRIANCIIAGNSSGGPGGGIHCHSADLVIANCVITDNSAPDCYRWGGGVYIDGYAGAQSIVNCVISGNSARQGGGVYQSHGAELTIENCTIVANLSGGGVYGEGSSHNLSIANCIIRDNTPAELLMDIDEPTVVYSNIRGGWPGAGNIDANPLFVDPDDYEYHLSAGSPCIDAGCNCGVPPDFADLDGDGDMDEITPFDLDGEGRFFDDPNTPDSGSGWPPIVDMGAYEFGGTGPQPCIGDLDNDRDVDLSDLAALLSNYGMTSGAGVSDGDLDCDGDVELADLAVLLANYGVTCE